MNLCSRIHHHVSTSMHYLLNFRLTQLIIIFVGSVSKLRNIISRTIPLTGKAFLAFTYCWRCYLFCSRFHNHTWTFRLGSRPWISIFAVLAYGMVCYLHLKSPWQQESYQQPVSIASCLHFVLMSSKLLNNKPVANFLTTHYLRRICFLWIILPQPSHKNEFIFSKHNGYLYYWFDTMPLFVRTLHSFQPHRWTLEWYYCVVFRQNYLPPSCLASTYPVVSYCKALLKS